MATNEEDQLALTGRDLKILERLGSREGLTVFVAGGEKFLDIDEPKEDSFERAVIKMREKGIEEFFLTGTLVDYSMELVHYFPKLSMDSEGIKFNGRTTCYCGPYVKFNNEDDFNKGERYVADGLGYLVDVLTPEGIRRCITLNIKNSGLSAEIKETYFIHFFEEIGFERYKELMAYMNRDLVLTNIALRLCKLEC